ncbi:unnamed protein product [Periconia digitata]|uniref:Uncharacterized protein n=1 Tax=Periconia digitata TaxID=1303443 RepID=A0A9W4XQD7_9PLEO|nr:unnamed protein product [Periconia digitata]
MRKWQFASCHLSYRPSHLQAAGFRPGRITNVLRKGCSAALHRDYKVTSISFGNRLFSSLPWFFRRRLDAVPRTMLRAPLFGHRFISPWRLCALDKGEVEEYMLVL